MPLLAGQQFTVSNHRSPVLQAHYTTLEDIGVKIFRPRKQTLLTELLPCLIYLHGGGWTLGSAGKILHSYEIL